MDSVDDVLKDFHEEICGFHDSIKANRKRIWRLEQKRADFIWMNRALLLLHTLVVLMLAFLY